MKTNVSSARSWLFVPGSRPDRFERALSAGADGVIIDLEDAVAEGAKEAARGNVVKFIQAQHAEALVAVRINTLDSEVGSDDLNALGAAVGLDAVVLPKTQSSKEIETVSRTVEKSGSNAVVIALIETARGVGQCENIADTGRRLAGLMFGAADYAADMGLEAGDMNADYARARIANAAAAASLTSIDSPFFAIDDIDTLAEECRRSRRLGFFGKAAIHPLQVKTIVDVFAPTAKEIARANRILEIAHDGAGVVDGSMTDEAMVRWARRILKRD